MKSKILSLFILTAILSIAMVSAAADFTISDNSQTITSIVENATNTTISGLTYTDDTSMAGDISVTIDTTDGTLVTIDTSLVDFEKLDIGSVSGTLYLADGDIVDVNETINIIIIKTFCELGEQSYTDIEGDKYELELKDVEISNDDGDDYDWVPLDTITIEVEVENTGDDKIRDIIVELGLFDEDGDNIIDDMNGLDDEQIELGRLSEGDDETVIFEFQVPADFEEQTYTLVIKAYSDDEGEDTICTSYSSDFDTTSKYYEIISGERETDEENHIVVDSIRISPSTAECSEIVQVSAEVFNIGDEDYEDQVKVTLYNEALGIDMTKTIREDFDQGDSEEIEFEFTIPENAEPATYLLEFRTYYDYDDKDDYYNLMSEKRFYKSILVDGNCVIISESNVEITAQLDSETPEANAGEQVIVTTTLENTGEDSTLYTVSVYGNSAWSSVSGIDPTTVIIPAGESKEIDIILDLDKDAQGDKEFTIKVTHDGEETEQKVALSINAKTSSGITGAAISDHIKENGFIYAIVLINLILIIAIILVIRRMVTSNVPAGI